MRHAFSAKRICFLAVMASLIALILFFGSLVDVLDISLALIAGVLVMIVDAEEKDAAAWSVFFVSALLSFFLQAKSAFVLYLLFFGWYPIVRKKLDPLPKWLRYLLKFLIFNLLTGAYLFLSVRLFGADGVPGFILLILVPVANGMFLLYDMMLDRFILFYYFRLRHRLGFRRKK